MTSASENTDRLTSLPDELLSRILSVMPTKFAMQTCILSKSWRYSWTLADSLDFDDIHHSLHNKDKNAQFRWSEVHDRLYGSKPSPEFQQKIYRTECFSTFVDQVFELSKRPQLKKFRFHVGSDWICVSKSVVSEWINKAIMLNVCELDIGVRYNQYHYIEFPLSMSTCKTLTKFTLHILNECWICPSSINLPFLKTLDIFCPKTKTPNIYCVDRALEVIHACPVLENLSLESSCNNKDYTFNIPTLRKLKLTISKSGPVNKVFLNVPNLEHLFLGGDLCSNFYMEDLSSKVEVRVSCEIVNDSCLLAELLKRLSGAKYISSTNYPDGKHVNLKYPNSKYPNLKRLELNGYVGLGWQLITQILENCSELGYLSFEKPNEGCWNEPESVPTCMLLSLKTMKYANATCYWDDMRFLKFMLGNSNVLKTLTLRYAPTLSDTEKTRLRKNIAMHAKASKDCEICFV